MTRVDVKAILADPAQRKALMVPTIQAIQNREGIDATLEQAEAAYDKVANERVVDYEHNDTRLEIHRAVNSIKNNKVRPERLAYKARQ